MNPAPKRAWRQRLRRYLGRPFAGTDLHSLFGNTLLIFLSNGILKASNAILFILVVNGLGKDAAGRYSIATTYVAIALNLALFGLDEILIREAVRRGDQDRLFANFLAIRVVLGILSVLILALFLVISKVYGPDLTLLIALLSLSVVGDGVLLLCQALFISRERVKLVLITATAISLARILSGLFVMNQQGQLYQLMALFVVTSLAGGALAAWFAQNRILRLPMTGLLKMLDVRDALHWVRRSGSFFWISLFVMVEFQADVILLSILRSPADVAIYSAALTIIIAAWIVPQAYRTVIYPRMAQALRRSLTEFWRFVRITVGPAAIFGACLSGGLVLVARPLIDLLYPSDYNSSVIVLRVLTLPLFFAFLSAPSSRALLTLHRERVAAILVGIMMAVNVAGNLWLIPRYGPLGAAWARAFSGSTFCALSYLTLVLLRRRVDRREADGT
jgi:O-antigen/teichoic acid export membrane protein